MFLTAGRRESAAMAGRDASAPRDLLVLLAAPSPDPADLRAAVEALPGSQTAALLDRIAYHRIDGLAHRVLAGLPEGAVDAWLRRSLKRRREKIAAATLSQGLALAEVLESFHRAGLPVVVMRGLRSVEAIYGEPGSRPFQDHDLLVRTTDRPAAESLLGRRGFERAAPALFRRGGVLVDLHVDPLGAARRPTRAALFPLTTETIFAGSRPGTVAGSPALIAPLEDEILLNAIHLVKHSFDRLIRTADLAHLIVHQGQAICWRTLERRAAATCAGRLLGWGFEAASLLGAEGPAALRPGPAGSESPSA